MLSKHLVSSGGQWKYFLKCSVWANQSLSGRWRGGWWGAAALNFRKRKRLLSTTNRSSDENTQMPAPEPRADLDQERSIWY